MASSSSISPENLLCRFFATASCRDGAQCRFSHDRSITIMDNVCRYYLVGRCYYGPQCRYDHVKIKLNNCKNRRNAATYDAQYSINERAAKDSTPTTLFRGNLPTRQNTIDTTNEKPVTIDTTRSKSVAAEPNREKPVITDPKLLNWVNAPEFVPKVSHQMSYAEKLIGQEYPKKPKHHAEICAYYEIGDCPFGETCDDIHGDNCDICGKACLIPFDNEQQQKHKVMCEKEFVENMELSFAVQKSRDKTCGICFDTIMEKQPLSERRFGIMEKCNHVFCLSCIRKWRKVRPDLQYFENVLDTNVTRACPECRLPSDFIIPNSYFVDDDEEKKKLIDTYKENLSKKPCKYFRKGEGNCPFGGACFYLHQYPDGTKATLPLPTRRRRQNQNGDMDFVERIFLSDFFNDHDDPLLMNVSFSDLVYVLSDDSDDEDSGESYSFFFDEHL